MSSIGANNCTVTGSAGGPWTVTFGGALGNQVVTTMTGSAGGLTGGTPTLTLASVTSGVAPAQSWTLPAGTVLSWNSQDAFYSNPITTNIVQLNITNATGAAVVFTFIAGMAA